MRPDSDPHSEYSDRLLKILRLHNSFIAYNSVILVSVLSAIIQVIFWLCFDKLILTHTDLNTATVLILITCTTVPLAHAANRSALRYRRGLAERMASSGLVSRLALGWEQSVGIHDYVAFPWSIFLGARPVDLADTLRLVVDNLDWYLGEPRRYINPRWIISASLIMLWFLVMGGLEMFAGGNFPWAIMFTILILIPGIYVHHHYALRRHLAVRLLHTELTNCFNR